MKFHPDVLAAHAQFGGDLETMQRCYEWYDLKSEIESLRSRAEKAEAELRDARETNRKLHRRLQLAEAVQQSAEDYLGSWLQIFTPSRKDRRGERHFIMYILRDAKRHVAKLSERYSATYRKEVSE